jgi:hypothetical protein
MGLFITFVKEEKVVALIYPSKFVNFRVRYIAFLAKYGWRDLDIYYTEYLSKVVTA